MSRLNTEVKSNANAIDICPGSKAVSDFENQVTMLAYTIN